MVMNNVGCFDSWAKLTNAIPKMILKKIAKINMLNDFNLTKSRANIVSAEIIIIIPTAIVVVPYSKIRPCISCMKTYLDKLQMSISVI